MPQRWKIYKMQSKLLENEVFEAFGKSDIGKRAKNEDFLAILPEHNFFALADGMGGHSAGEVASKLANLAVQKSIREFLHPNNLPLSKQEIAGHIKHAIMQAGNELFFLSQKHADYKGMGTTFSCLYLYDKFVTYAHIGDSRIYLFRQNQLQLLTSDHNLASNLNLPDSMVPLSYKKMITKALGCGLNAEPTLAQKTVFLNDVFLLCSDGLSDYVSKHDIEKILKKSNSMQQVSEKLIEKAKCQNSSDNISVIVLKIKSL